jgi:hypothetical protein
MNGVYNRQQTRFGKKNDNIFEKKRTVILVISEHPKNTDMNYQDFTSVFWKTQCCPKLRFCKRNYVLSKLINLSHNM